jgi:hypothetical protein
LDGRFVAFTSQASNLVSSDTNGWEDVFVRDRRTAVTILVGVASDGSQNFYGGNHPAIDSLGRHTAFVHNGWLTPGATPPDVYVRSLADTDVDGEWDPFDFSTDTDGDLIANPVESKCGSNPDSAASFPERTDRPGDDDGDGLVNEPLPAGSEAHDCDGDGFSGATEQYVFSAANTAHDQACANAWPADIDNDGFSDISDVIFLTGAFGTELPPAPVRYDLARDTPRSFVDITDIVRMLFFFGKRCGE